MGMGLYSQLVQNIVQQAVRIDDSVESTNIIVAIPVAGG